MKKLLCLALMLFGVISIFAQEKTIEKTEFDNIYKESSRVLFANSRRVTTKTESLTESAVSAPLNIESRSISEFLPDVGYRSVYESSLRSANSKTETIVIANKMYKRQGSGDWTVETLQPIAAPPTQTFKTLDSKIEYKSLGMEKINNQNANIYVQSETSKIVSLKTNAESISTTVSKYWVGEDGRLLKAEHTHKIANNRFINTINSTIFYELDPTIKIEAPNLK